MAFKEHISLLYLRWVIQQASLAFPQFGWKASISKFWRPIHVYQIKFIAIVSCPESLLCIVITSTHKRSLFICCDIEVWTVAYWLGLWFKNRGTRLILHWQCPPCLLQYSAAWKLDPPPSKIWPHGREGECHWTAPGCSEKSYSLGCWLPSPLVECLCALTAFQGDPGGEGACSHAMKFSDSIGL